MNNIGVVKTADNVGKSVNVANMREKLITKSFSLARTFDKARDIDKFYGGWNFLLAF